MAYGIFHGVASWKKIPRRLTPLLYKPVWEDGTLYRSLKYDEFIRTL
jgi:hypothetical protein